MAAINKAATGQESSPARGTWIEMQPAACAIIQSVVVPRKGDVDRNLTFSAPPKVLSSVVPRKGDVDRNTSTLRPPKRLFQSSPARGTWIEITLISTEKKR